MRHIGGGPRWHCTTPCPFCGEAALVEPGDIAITMDNIDYWQAHCIECQADGPLVDSPEGAVRLWDQRDEGPAA